MSITSRSSEEWMQFGRGFLPEHLGMNVLHVGESEVSIELSVAKHLMAPNGFLHAGAVIALADTACGYGCLASLPTGAEGFTTLETKSNHMGTAREGIIDCRATKVHAGRSTQVWDAFVRHRDSSKVIAMSAARN